MPEEGMKSAPVMAEAADKKLEIKPAEESKEIEKKSNESNVNQAAPLPPPPPPPEIVLKVFMHCEGCAKKVRRCLKGFEGVEDVVTDCRTGKVVVRGRTADPVKVMQRVQQKSHRQVQLISPIPEPTPPPPPAVEKPPEIVVPKPQDKIEELEVITVVLGVYMHCEACALEINKRIHKLRGVQSTETDLKNSKVTIKGAFNPEKICEQVYKRTGKHTRVIKVEPVKKEEKKEEEKKEDEEEVEEEDSEEEEEEALLPNENEEEKKAAEEVEKGDTKKSKEEPKEAVIPTGGGGGGGKVAPPVKVAAAGPPVMAEGGGNGELEEENEAVAKKNEVVVYNNTTNNMMNMNGDVNWNLHRYPPRYVQEMIAYPPQIFSDENPNACCVM